jgi:hypothetical protein
MHQGQDRRLWSPFVAGGLGDATACLFSHPMDVAKVRLQLKGELSSVPQQTGIRNIFLTQFINGKDLWKGSTQDSLLPYYDSLPFHPFVMAPLVWFTALGWTNINSQCR